MGATASTFLVFGAYITMPQLLALTGLRPPRACKPHPLRSYLGLGHGHHGGERNVPASGWQHHGSGFAHDEALSPGSLSSMGGPGGLVTPLAVRGGLEMCMSVHAHVCAYVHVRACVSMRF